MNLFQQYPVFSTLLKPFRRSQQKTLAALTIALAHAAQASTFAIAGELASATQVQLGSAITRIYRCLRNTRIDDLLLTQTMLTVLARDGRLILALDWTQWPNSLSMLVAAVIVGTRAIPVQASVVSKSQLARSQNYWEETFARLTVDCLRRAASQSHLVMRSRISSREPGSPTCSGSSRNLSSESVMMSDSRITEENQWF